ncbi:MAG TPA: hypothetical protein VIM67_08090, partial [Terriglobus sp.]
MRSKMLVSSLLAVVLLSASAQTVKQGTFRAGAAKVDITLQQSELPKNYLGVLDPVYARAVVVSNGEASAALITLDAGGVPNPVWEHVSQRIERELGIPATNVLITATHSHAV